MPALHINDPAAVDLAERLAHHAGVSRTQLLLDALQLYRDEKYPDLPMAESATASPETKQAQLKLLDSELRRITLEYQRLQAKVQGKPSVGSRVYKMIADNGVIGTLEKLVERKTDGLEFLIENNRLNLAAENLVLDDRFKLVVSDEMREKAERNLRKARAALMT
ncbi:hypothetical protein [Bradyrhizobium sp. MOS002]|uniref:hypothetical protein n=1 Tax=Bradyrhizobium sp. MOS002 TaxID=2133947 RepID=UPI000D127DDF|nr:hypothetical protein [Bradyrhizobium sp. MOS002]PSO25198.1 hypothetical protein C7G41_30280 [Bradyrhizobium sp. MOS002]